MSEVKLEKKYLSSGIGLIQNPGLIKITTIKKKHIEGLPQYHEKDISYDLLTGEVDVIGQHSYKVILQRKDGHLFFIHEMHVRRTLMEYAQEVKDGGITEESIYNDTQQYAHDEMEKFTQIFAD